MIQDSVYVISGGSSGLGEGTAEVLLSEGAHITILDLQAPAANSKIRQYEDRLLILQVDVTSEKDVLNAIDATKRRFGKINGLINCAGIYIKASLYNSETNEPHNLREFTKIIDVNLIGTFNVLRLVVPVMMENQPDAEGERGVIINTSSVVGHHGNPILLAYSASKAAVIAMTYPLAKELGTYGIRVLDIAPGYMDTPMTQSSVAKEVLENPISSKFVFPHRKGRPSEFGELVKSIIQNRLLNGTSIKLDGGYRL